MHVYTVQCMSALHCVDVHTVDVDVHCANNARLHYALLDSAYLHSVCVCLEYMRDAYLQPERLMLVHRAVIADTNDHHVSLASSTLAKLSPPTKRTGLSVSLCLCLSVCDTSN